MVGEIIKNALPGMSPESIPESLETAVQANLPSEIDNTSVQKAQDRMNEMFGTTTDDSPVAHPSVATVVVNEEPHGQISYTIFVNRRFMETECEQSQ